MLSCSICCLIGHDCSCIYSINYLQQDEHILIKLRLSEPHDVLRILAITNKEYKKCIAVQYSTQYPVQDAISTFIIEKNVCDDYGTNI